MRRLIQATAMAMALALAAFGLVACGSDSDEDKIKDLVERGFNDADPSICTDLFTTNFVEVQWNATGADAIGNCEFQVENEGLYGENASVENVEIDGDSATADVSFETDGEEKSFELVKDGDDWKIDGIS